MKDLKTINAFAHVFGNLGYNVHARNFFKALDNLVEVALIPIYPFNPKDIVDEQIKKMLERGKKPDTKNNLSIRLDYGDKMSQFSGKKRIGYTVFESTKITKDWIFQINQLDQVWIPSHWGKKVMIENGINEELIRVVPEGVDCSIYHIGLEPLPDLNSDNFKFLSIGKWEKRKSSQELLIAFIEEFKPDEKVELICQFYNPFYKQYFNFDIKQELSKLHFDNYQNIKMINPLPTSSDLARLYNSCDCFVMPTKAEAWGLPIIEAMACGLPVITTNYSGQTEFINEKNAYLIDIIGMEDVYDPLFFPKKGEHGQWATPDFNQLKKLMRYVFENQKEAKEKGKYAAQDIKNNWSWDNAAKIALRHLEELL